MEIAIIRNPIAKVQQIIEKWYTLFPPFIYYYTPKDSFIYIFAYIVTQILQEFTKMCIFALDSLFVQPANESLLTASDREVYLAKIVKNDASN